MKKSKAVIVFGILFGVFLAAAIGLLFGAIANTEGDTLPEYFRIAFERIFSFSTQNGWGGIIGFAVLVVGAIIAVLWVVFLIRNRKPISILFVLIFLIGTVFAACNEAIFYDSVIKNISKIKEFTTYQFLGFGSYVCSSLAEVFGILFFAFDVAHMNNMRKEHHCGCGCNEEVIEEKKEPVAQDDVTEIHIETEPEPEPEPERAVVEAPAKEPEVKAEEKAAKPVKKAPAKKAPVKKAQPKKEEAKDDEDFAEIKKVYHVSKRKEDQLWVIKFAGGEKVIKTFRTKAEAVEYAEQLAENQEGIVLTHASKGKKAGKINAKL